MSVQHVTIEDAHGRRYVLSTPFTIKDGSGMRIRVAGQRNAVLSLPGREDAYSAAAGRLSALRYVSSISGQRPVSDGLVMITGDRCMSWTHDEDSDSGALRLYDLCPACSSCDTYAKMLRRLEACKLAINMLKDVNLYTNDLSAERAAWLYEQRMELPEACPDESDSVPDIFSVQLLKQYIATVYMWNYLVAAAGIRDEVITSPDSASGLSARSRYVASVCSDGSRLSATIDIQPYTVPNQNRLSLYVPTPEVSILPEVSGSGCRPRVRETRASTLHTTVSVDFNRCQDDSDATVQLATGTYAISVTALPFEAVDNGSSTTIIDTPTAADYNNSVGLASLVQDDMAVWQVVITWHIRGDLTKDVRHEYLLQTMLPSLVDPETLIDPGELIPVSGKYKQVHIRMNGGTMWSDPEEGTDINHIAIYAYQDEAKQTVNPYISHHNGVATLVAVVPIETNTISLHIIHTTSNVGSMTSQEWNSYWNGKTNPPRYDVNEMAAGSWPVVGHKFDADLDWPLTYVNCQGPGEEVTVNYGTPAAYSYNRMTVQVDVTDRLEDLSDWLKASSYVDDSE